MARLLTKALKTTEATEITEVGPNRPSLQVRRS